MNKKIFIIGVIIFAIVAFVLILYRSSRPRPAIAFIIDDWGYNKRYIDLVSEINRPLTIAILPNLRYSRYIAEEISKRSGSYDIILHLPLESKSNRAVEAGTIRCEMDKEKILSALNNGIESVPGIIGVSSHQGSKATGDERVMNVILEELGKRELFFVDSFTSPDSICQDVAKNLGIKFSTRDVFLDVTDQTDLENFESYIKGQIQELAALAVERGSAIGVGHNIETTLKVIKESIPDLEKQGIIIKPLKKMVR